MHATALDAKVAARNRVHALALAHWEEMREALRPFIGRKVQNVGGDIAAKVKAVLPTGEGWEGLHRMHYEATSYSLRVSLHTVESGPGMCGRTDYQIAHYAEVSLHLGSLDKGVLTELGQIYPLRTDYTAAEVQRWREELDAADKAKREAEYRLVLFGQYDR